MARPREFDTVKALEAAMMAFWRRGYAATSMSDLMEAMNLHKGSIYKAFGDKHDLFIAALEHYLSTSFGSLKSDIESAGTPDLAIRRFLESAISSCQKQSPCIGCFGVNSIVELGPFDDKVNAVMRFHFDRLSQLLVHQIEKGQQAGVFRLDRSATDLVEFLTTIQVGLVSKAKGRQDYDAFRRIVDLTLDQLKPD